MRRRSYPLSMLLWAMAWLVIAPQAIKRRRALRHVFQRKKKPLMKKWFREMDFSTARAEYRAARKRRKRRPLTGS